MTLPFIARPNVIKYGNDQFTKTLLHFDGNFSDNPAGGSVKTWTAAGSAAASGAAKFGTFSGSFNGSTQYISTPNHADFAFGTNDWSIDLWVNRQGGFGTASYFCGQVDSGFSTLTVLGGFTTGNLLEARAFVGGVNKTATSTTAISASGWNHVEIAAVSGTMRVFVNGAPEGSVALGGAVDALAQNFSVGRPGAYNGLYFNGLIDEFRICIGGTRHSAAFTPSITPYL